MRVVNVAHGEFFMLGAVVAWFVAGFMPGPAWLAFVAALMLAPLAVGALAAAADGLILKRLSYNPEATIVATIGLLYILQQAALSIYGPDARPVPAPSNGASSCPGSAIPATSSSWSPRRWLCSPAIWLLMTRTRAGLVMRATQVDRDVARAFGIDVDRVYMGTFALGAGLAAIAGVLIVPISQAHYLMGGDPLLLSFITVIIGGLGSLRGTLVAALVIGLSDGIISMFFTPTLAKIIATLLVAMVLVFRPQGLFGAKA